MSTRLPKAAVLAVTAVVLGATPAAADQLPFPVCVGQTTIYVAGRPVTVQRTCFPPG